MLQVGEGHVLKCYYSDVTVWEKACIEILVTFT
jgi:hypothetical protein